MGTLEFKTLQPADYSVWDHFCEEHNGAWFWHTTGFLTYQEIYRPGAGTRAMHFFALRDGQVVAVCPLARESIKREGQPERDAFSLGEDYIPAPVVADTLHISDKDRVLRAVYEEIDRQAIAQQIAYAAFRDAPLTPRFLTPEQAPENLFSPLGYFDSSLQTQILDLRLPEDDLWSHVRKSYHSLILKAEKVLAFECLDQRGISDQAFDAYRALHQKAAGRVTRSPETFQKMLAWIRAGHGLLTQIVKEGRVIACALIIVYKNKAYYASACNDPDWENTFPLGHLIQWKTIQELKKRGVTHYELGWQTTGPSLSYVPTPEEIQISFFKHAFGGATLPFHRGIKYHSPDAFRQDYTERIQQIETFLRQSIAAKA